MNILNAAKDLSDGEKISILTQLDGVKETPDGKTKADVAKELLEIGDAIDNTTSRIPTLTNFKDAVTGAKDAIIAFIKAHKALSITGGIIAGITAGVAIFNHFHDTVAETQEKVEGLMDTFEDSLSTAKSNTSTLQGLTGRYKELSEGVGNAGENISLTTEEYEEYNGIVNQIASMLPTMVQGYTDEGNAILKLKGNIEALNEASKESELNAYRELIASEDADDILTNWKNTQQTNFWDSFFDFGKKDVGGKISAQEAVDQLNAVAKMSYDEYVDLVKRNYEAVNGINLEAFNTLTDIEKEIFNNGGFLDQQLGLASNVIGANTSLTPEEYETVRVKAESLAQTYQTEIDSALAGVKTYANAYLMIDEDYQKLDETGKSIASVLVNSMTSEIANGLENTSDISAYVESILDIFNEGNEDVQAALISLFTVDTSEMSIEAAKTYIDNLIATISAFTGEPAEELKKRLGFTDTDTLYSNFKQINEKAAQKFATKDVPTMTTLAELNRFVEENSINTQDELAKWNKALEESRTIAEAMEKYKADSAPEETFKPFFEVFTSETFADAKESLMELAKAGKLSDKTLESTEEYKELLKQTGLSANEAKDKIMGLLTTQQKLAGTSQGLDAIKTAYQESFNDDIGFVTAETLESLPDVFKNLEGYDFNLFKSIVGNTKSTKEEVQQAFNDIVTAYVNSQGVIESVLYGTEADVQSVIDNLTQMGITNAKEAVNNAITQNDAYNTIYAITERAYIEYLNTKTQLENEQLATSDNNLKKSLQSKLDNNETFFENLVNTNRDAILKQFGQDYLDDYNNWCDALSAKASAYNEYIKEYMKGYEQQKALGNGLASPDPFYQEYYVLGGGKNVPLLNTNYGKNLQLDLGGNKVNYDSPDLLDGVNDSSKEKSKETFDWIEKALEATERKVTNFGKTVDATYKKWTTRNSDLAKQISAVNDQIDLQRKAYKAYMAEADAVGLSKTYKELVQSGKIDIQTITDEKLAEKIQQYEEFYDKAIGALDAIADLEAELASLARTQFDNVAKEFEDRLAAIEHEANILDGTLNQIETSGHVASASLYESLIEQESKNLATLKEQYTSLQQAFATAVKNGNIAEDSEEFNAMQQEINAVEEAILESNTAILEFQNSIRQLEWDSFDRLQEKINNITAEADFLISLLEDSDLYDDRGQLTDTGTATMGLHGQKYNTYMAQAEKYAEELQKINEEIAQDPNNLDLLEHRQELLELQQDSILAAQDEKLAIRDLVEEGINKELDSLQKLINKFNEARDNARDLYEYQKSINEQLENLSSLEKQMSVLQNDDSEEMQAKVQQLKVELEKAQGDLEESQMEHALEQEQKMLDELYSAYEQILNTRLDNLDMLIADMIARINDNSTLINDTLISEAEKVGYVISDSLQSIWNNENGLTTIISEYGNNFSSQLTSILDVLNKIADVESSIGDKTVVPEPSAPVTPPSTSSTPPSSDKGTSGDSTGASSSNKEITVGGKINAEKAKIYTHIGDKSGSEQYFKQDPIYVVLSEEDGYVKVRHHSLSKGVSGWFKKSDIKAYKTGGLVDETGLAWLDGTKQKPEMVLNAKDTENFKELTGVLREVSDNDWFKNMGTMLASAKPLFEVPTPTLPPCLPSAVNQNMNNTFNMNFELHNVTNGEDVINYLIKSDRFQNVVESMTVNRLVGGSKFDKHKFYR